MSAGKLAPWLAHIEQLHPREIDLDLDRVGQVHGRLGLRKDAGKAISIAGTNGKGSCACYLEAIYLVAGLRVGVYTSPHLRHFRERIRVNGEAVDDQEIVVAFEQIEAVRKDISLTYFEFATLAALYVFKKANVDICILEVGMGGRLDAVNIIDAEVAVITSICLDHQSWLGNTRELIGREKAGIFRTDRAAVIGDTRPPDSVLQHGAKVGARLLLSGSDFRFAKDDACWSWFGAVMQYNELPLPQFGGVEQLTNASVALAATEQMQLHFRIARQDIVSGLENAMLPGRVQKIKANSLWILDVAHNGEAAEALARALGDFSGRTIAVIALLQDKPVAVIATALDPHVDAWIVVSDNHARSLPAEDLAGQLSTRVAAPVQTAATVAAGLALAASTADATDRVVVTGSFHVVGPALDYLSQHS